MSPREGTKAKWDRLVAETEAERAAPLPPEGPRTEAGKALLREWLMLRPDHPPNTARVRDIIEAIEREGASPALDAAVRAVTEYSWGLHLAGTPNEAEAIGLIETLRAEYARLTASAVPTPEPSE